MRRSGGSGHLSLIYVEKRNSDSSRRLEIYLELIVKIKELEKNERPRERAIRYGIDKLSNEELLAIIIRTGWGDDSALDIAHTLNGQSHGLDNLFHKPYKALLDTKGIGPSKALTLKACFELCLRYVNYVNGETGKVELKDIYYRYKEKMKNSSVEIFILIVLNRKKEIIYEETIFSGGEHIVSCPLDEVVKKVIINNGKSFYVLHNHPNGDAYPSNADIYVTDELIRLAKKLKILMEDHLIFGDDEIYSFTLNEKLRNI